MISYQISHVRIPSMADLSPPQAAKLGYFTFERWRPAIEGVFRCSASSHYNHNITNQRLTTLGITIFDITNLSRIAYCFVDFFGMECNRSVPLMTPLSARIYLEAYYELTEDLLPLVESFQGYDLIPTSLLEDAWPDEGWMDAETDVQEGGEEPDLQLEKLEITPTATLDTLRSQTMDTLIQNLLDSPEENSSLVVEAELLTDFLPKLKDKIYDQAKTLKWSSYHLDLLFQALQNELEVDLGPLTNIPAEDLAIIVEKLYKNGKVSILNLSNRSDISLEDLHYIIGTGTRLRVLCLLEMPQIPLKSLGQYLVNLEVHHSDLLRWGLRAYSYFDYFNSSEMVAKTKFPGTGTVSKIVWTGLSKRGSMSRRNYLPNGRIAWENLTLNPDKLEPFPGRTTLEQRSYDLHVPLPPCKLVPGVLRLLQWLGSTHLSNYDSPSRGIACSLASLLPHTNGTGHGISLLSPGLYAERDICQALPSKTRLFSLKAGEWVLFLISEAFDARDGSFADRMFDDQSDTLTGAEEATEVAQAPEVDLAAHKNPDIELYPRKATSYALATRLTDSEPSQYMIADIPTYIKSVFGGTPWVQELIDVWTSGFPSIKNAEFFGDDTYKILRKLSSGDSTLESKETQGAKQGAEHDDTRDIQVGGTDTGDHGAGAD